jgi:recombination protein RecT
VDWFGGDRGELIGVYAYASMQDGATSQVIIMDRAEVHRARDKSASYRAKPEASPWSTDTASMWLKTAAHRLRKWVPTSAEYRRELARASAEAQKVSGERPQPDGDLPPPDEAYAIDGEVVEPTAEEWPEPATPGGGAS